MPLQAKSKHWADELIRRSDKTLSGACPAAFCCTRSYGEQMACQNVPNEWLPVC